MKIFPLLILGSATLLGGCASDNSNQAAEDHGTSYVSLGSNIPRKNNNQPSDSQKVDMQQLENARAMNSGTINGPGSR